MNPIRRFAIALTRLILAPSSSRPPNRRRTAQRQPLQRQFAPNSMAPNRNTQNRNTQNRSNGGAIVHQPKSEVVYNNYPSNESWGYANGYANVDRYRNDIGDHWDDWDDWEEGNWTEESFLLYSDTNPYRSTAYYPSPYSFNPSSFDTSFTFTENEDEDDLEEDWEDQYGLVDYRLARLGGDVFIEFSYEDDLDEAEIIQALSYLWKQAPSRYQNDFSGTLRLPLRQTYMNQTYINQAYMNPWQTRMNQWD